MRPFDFHDPLGHIAAAQAIDEGFHLGSQLLGGAFLRRLALRSPWLRLRMRSRQEELALWTGIKWAADGECQGRYKSGDRRSD